MPRVLEDEVIRDIKCLVHIWSPILGAFYTGLGPLLKPGRSIKAFLGEDTVLMKS